MVLLFFLIFAQLIEASSADEYIEVVVKTDEVPLCPELDNAQGSKMLKSIIGKAEKEFEKAKKENPKITSWVSPDSHSFNCGFKDAKGKKYKITNFKLDSGKGYAKKALSSLNLGELVKSPSSFLKGKRYCEYALKSVMVTAATYSFNIEVDDAIQDKNVDTNLNSQKTQGKNDTKKSNEENSKDHVMVSNSEKDGEANEKNFLKNEPLRQHFENNFSNFSKEERKQKLQKEFPGFSDKGIDKVLKIMEKESKDSKKFDDRHNNTSETLKKKNED
jgi:hypothetical protein